jgi:hypothetical protein
MNPTAEARTFALRMAIACGVLAVAIAVVTIPLVYRGSGPASAAVERRVSGIQASNDLEGLRAIALALVDWNVSLQEGLSRITYAAIAALVVLLLVAAAAFAQVYRTLRTAKPEPGEKAPK